MPCAEFSIMPGILNVYFLPKLVEPEELLDETAVVIDVLRSTTTIVHALAAGAREVIPCAEVEEARKIAGELPSDESSSAENAADWRYRGSIWATRRKTTRPSGSAAKRSSLPPPTARGRWPMPNRRRRFF